MKIVILADQIKGGGGAGVIAWNQAVELVRLGHEVHVVTTAPYENGKGVVVHTIETKEYPVLLRAYRALNNPPLVRKVEAILKDLKPDIVHAHNIHLHLSYKTLMIAKKYAKAVFHTVHDSMPFHYSKLFPETVGAESGVVKSYKVSPWKQLKLFKWQYNPLRNFFIRKYLRIPDQIFAVSHALADALRDNGIQNVAVLHNGINIHEWQTTEDEKTETPYIFFGGRLSAVKGGEVLVDAMHEVTKTHPDAKILVVGEDGTYVRAMKKKMGEKGIETTGWRDRNGMKKEYARASVVVVPSLCFDWFPTIVLEAMASKKPVIATCFGGAKEAIEEGKTGFIINPKKSRLLAERILSVLENPEKAAEMGRLGYERVRDEFSMEKHLQKLLVWYDKALKNDN